MPTKNRPSYTRASESFKADSFTVYKLNISHLCDGACEGTSEWTISKLGTKNVTIKAVDPTAEVTTFTLTLDALLKAYDLVPENAEPLPSTPPSPLEGRGGAGTGHASKLRTIVLVTDDLSSPFDVDPLVHEKMPNAPLRTIYDYDLSPLLKLIKDGAPVTKDHLRACFDFMLAFVGAAGKSPKHSAAWVGRQERQRGDMRRVECVRVPATRAEEPCAGVAIETRTPFFLFTPSPSENKYQQLRKHHFASSSRLTDSSARARDSARVAAPLSPRPIFLRSSGSARLFH